MKFELDDDHYEFASVVGEALERMSPAAVARSLVEGGPPEVVDPMLRQLASLGVTGLTVPLEHGGSGLGLSDCVLVLEQLGRHLVPDSVAEGLGVVAPITAAHASPHTVVDVLAPLTTGELTVSVQDGWDGCAPSAASVDLVLVVADDEVVLTEPRAADVVGLAGVDGTRRLGRVSAAAPRVAVFGAAVAREARARAAVTAAAVLLGVARAMIDRAVAYAGERRQFGRPIGSFQAVKHQLADAFVDVEASRRTVWWAALALDDGSDEANEAVPMAKAMAGEAAQRASYAALQVHGGIGYTWECDLHLWMKRAQALQGAWGGADAHWRELARVSRRSGLALAR